MNFKKYYGLMNLMESMIPLDDRVFHDEKNFTVGKLPDEYKDYEVVTFNHGSEKGHPERPNMIFTFILDGDKIVAFAQGNEDNPLGVTNKWLDMEGIYTTKEKNPMWQNVMEKDKDGEPTTIKITPPFK